MMKPTYLGLDQARDVLSEMGIEFNDRQIRRAAEKNAAGKRKLPFFVDPIDGRLKIEKDVLIRAYMEAQNRARRELDL
ncbi:hypothetical protein [Roseospira visakhapatnamensis]|uniref:Uncharacterized protein n=1 Tax=Roseospira visakhapatnamensis TaxID=390880 RepID=A0A7W6RG51_9PROT|nr:hypothetical protein [Roseospira visakhapatnamensis]MBB4267923.1 hypothetical protein [Roseospira visakhapatnamensis]